MLKRIFLVIYSLLVLCLLKEPVNALSYSDRLSPAIDILIRKEILRKSNLAGSTIEFSQEDFEKTIGENSEYIVIKNLPSKKVGFLEIKGHTVEINQKIKEKEYSSIRFIPNSKEIGNTEFRYYVPNRDAEYSCVLTFLQEEAQNISADSLHCITYKNVSVFGNVTKKENEKVEVIKVCKNGIISLDPTNGNFSYTPKRNFFGTDQIYYKIIDENGNSSPPQVISVSIKEAKDNLFFHDMIKDPLHSKAIELCSEGIFEYSLDEKGYPIFSGEETISERTFKKVTSLIKEGKESQEVLSYEDNYTKMTKIECLKKICEILNG